jgi:hypothetical protein
LINILVTITLIEMETDCDEQDKPKAAEAPNADEHGWTGKGGYAHPDTKEERLGESVRCAPLRRQP